MKSFKTQIHLAMIVLTLSLEACAKHDSQQENQPAAMSQEKQDQTNYYKDYYKKFIYSADKCMSMDYRYYRFLGSSGMPTVLSDFDYNYDLKLYLKNDMTYEAELLLLKSNPKLGYGVYQNIETYQVKGKWSVNGSEIEFENLGVGRPTRETGSDGIDLFLSGLDSANKIHNSGTVLTRVMSTTVPKNLEITCEYASE